MLRKSRMKPSEKATQQVRANRKRVEWDDSEAVEEFIRKLDHPLKPALEAVRKVILDADSRITEGIKWNSPSFYCNGWFASANTRGKDSILIVFHLGAKVKDNSTAGMQIEDTTGLLEWVAKERALVRFRTLEEFNSRQNALKSIVSQWIKQLQPRT